MCDKWLREKEWDELIQCHNKENQDDKVDNNKRDEKHDNVNTNDDADDKHTLHINDCVALHNHPQTVPLSVHT